MSGKADSPDYAGAAAQDAESSKFNTRFQTEVNRINQYTPFGSQTFTPIEYDADGFPIHGSGSTTTTLNEVDQGILDRDRETSFERSGMANALLPGLFEQMSGGQQDLPEWAGAPQVPDFYGQGLSDFGQAGEAEYNPDFAQTNYDRNLSLMEPKMERDTKALEASLRNQGLQPGTEAYDNAVSDQRISQEESLNRLSQDSVGRGAEEQQREFGRDMGVGEFFNSARGQQVAEQLGFGGQGFNQQIDAQQAQNQLRQGVRGEGIQDQQINLNLINALLSGGQVGMTQMPGFNPAGRADTSNMLGAAGAQGNFDNTQSQIAMSPLNAAIGAAGTAAGGWASGL